MSAESGKDFLHKAMKENNELISIFVKAIQTSLKNQSSQSSETKNIKNR